MVEDVWYECHGGEINISYLASLDALFVLTPTFNNSLTHSIYMR